MSVGNSQQHFTPTRASVDGVWLPKVLAREKVTESLVPEAGSGGQAYRQWPSLAKVIKNNRLDSVPYSEDASEMNAIS